jgi:microcin C transport system substrate-binding protein
MLSGVNTLIGRIFAAAPAVYRGHGVAMHGDLKYARDFKHFDYSDPKAPKGGAVRLASKGSFNSLNPFILKGDSAPGLHLLFDSLMIPSADEPFSLYGLIAEEISFPEDRSSVTFKIRKEAKFHDGTPITPEDVIFSMEILKKKGHPFYFQYYKDVDYGEKLDDHTVRFVFSKKGNRELPLIVGELTVLPKHYWDTRDFEKTTFEPPLGGGPYKIKKFEAGRYIVYERVKNWWGENLAVNKGRYNFDSIHYQMFLDDTALLEAFLAGKYDFRYESVSKQWMTGYNSPALKKGQIIKEEIQHERPAGMQAFIFNTRKSVFRDRKVREALAYAFDFEWINKTMFFGAYKRSKSFFSNSELASRGLPSAEELKILERYKGRIPEEVFTKEYTPPSTDGSGNNRKNLRKGLRLLKQAGWTLDRRTKKLINKKTKQFLSFEILLASPSFERIVLAFVDRLEKLGVTTQIKLVDPSTYTNRVRQFDFDMVIGTFGQSNSPGNEQRNYWGSYSADRKGSRNLMGIKNPVIDELIELVITAPDRKSLITRVRALDRVLLWGHYVIPQWHHNIDRIAYWDIFDRPRVLPKYGIDFFSWWIK